MSRNKYPEETVKLILETAARLFTAKGFERTSLQDIMDETKLSKGAIYHHFASKEDIFIKICENTSKRTELLLSKVRDNEKMTGKEKLKALFSAALRNTVNDEIVPMQTYMISNPKFLADAGGEPFERSCACLCAAYSRTRYFRRYVARYNISPSNGRIYIAAYQFMAQSASFTFHKSRDTFTLRSARFYSQSHRRGYRT